MKPSINTGVYHACLLLESDAKGLASILLATCECAAAYANMQMIILHAYAGIIFSENLLAVPMYQ